MTRRLGKTIAVFLMCAASVTVWADTSNKDVIDYRQQVMKTLNEQAAALGQMMSTVVPDDNMASHLEAIALTASVALNAFVPKVQGGESKEEVWKDWGDFSKRMKEFAQKTAAAAKLVKSGAKDEAMGDITDALSCKSCHDVYRDPTAE